MPCAGSVVLWQKFEAELPTADVSHREWQQAAQRWAELVVLRWEWDESLDAADRTAWGELQATVEDAFGQWMMNRYGSLHNLPYHQQPVMVHQISRFMAVERTRKKIDKIALLVLDGLAFDQWLLLRKNLEALRQGVAIPGIDGLRLGSDAHFRHPPVDLRRGAAALLPGLAGDDLEGEDPLAAVLGGPGRSAGRRRSGHEPGRSRRPEAGDGAGQSPAVGSGDCVEQGR